MELIRITQAFPVDSGNRAAASFLIGLVKQSVPGIFSIMDAFKTRPKESAMVKIMPFALGLMLLALPGIAFPAGAEFDRMDWNKDGKVTQEEFLRWYPVEVWKKVDGTGKGYVSETEWIPVRESVAKYKREKARDARVKD
jgi:hypothetical protein